MSENLAAHKWNSKHGPIKGPEKNTVNYSRGSTCEVSHCHVPSAFKSDLLLNCPLSDLSSYIFLLLGLRALGLVT